MQKLGQAPGVHVQPELFPGCLIHGQIGLIIVQVHHLGLALLIRPGPVPVDIHLGIPVELLAQIVKLFDAVVLNLVIPVVGTGQGGLEYLGNVIHITTGQQVLKVGIVFLATSIEDGGLLWRTLRFTIRPLLIMLRPWRLIFVIEHRVLFIGD